MNVGNDLATAASEILNKYNFIVLNGSPQEAEVARIKVEAINEVLMTASVGTVPPGVPSIGDGPQC